MSSEGDPKRVGEMQFFEDLRRKIIDPSYVTATQRWEAENPQLAADWSAAWQEDRDRRETAERKVEQRKRELGRLDESLAPKRAVEICQKGLDDSQALQSVRDMTAQDKSFLLLSGGPGTGKTIAAVSAIHERAKENRRSLFLRASTLARLSLFDADDKALFALATRVGLLVVDDLGAESLHDGWRPLLDELIDERYSRMLPTIITTNLPPSAPDGRPSVRGRYGERIADRLRHDGIIASCGDISKRKRPE